MTNFDDIEWAYQNEGLQVGWHDDRPDDHQWEETMTNCWQISAYPESILWSEREPVLTGVGIEHAVWFQTKEKADAFIASVLEMGWHIEVLHMASNTRYEKPASRVREGYMVNAKPIHPSMIWWD